MPGMHRKEQGENSSFDLAVFLSITSLAEDKQGGSWRHRTGTSLRLVTASTGARPPLSGDRLTAAHAGASRSETQCKTGGRVRAPVWVLTPPRVLMLAWVLTPAWELLSCP